MLVTMVVIGILAMTAVYSWPKKAFEYDLIAQKMREDIRYTQVLAMNKGERFRFNFSHTSYWISDESGTAIMHPMSGTASVTFPSGVVLDWSASVETPEVANASGVGMDLIFLTEVPEITYISFNAKGIPYRGNANVSEGVTFSFGSSLANVAPYFAIRRDTGYIDNEVS